MKCLLIICDGMADRPVEALGFKTPLERARTPNLDAIAKGGVCGIVDTIAPGIRPGSDTAHLAILGYDPVTAYTGRGPFEAAGVGLSVKSGEIAFRCNFATVDEAGLILDRRAGRISEGTKELAKAINNIKLPCVKIRFKESTGHRGALVLSGDNLSNDVSDSDPHAEGVRMRDIEPLSDSEPAKRTAEVLNSFIRESRRVLDGHHINTERIQDNKKPANILLLRGAGAAPSLIPFPEKFRMKSGCIATVALVRGVGRFCGLDVVGADPSTSIEGLGDMAMKAMSDYDFILLNIKAADDATHDGDVQKKVSVIEEIDRVMAGFQNFTKENYLAILSDHTSSIALQDHCGDPVPIVIAGPEIRRDSVDTFQSARLLKEVYAESVVRI